MMGVGLAVAIFIDATLVRGVLLPAALAALGERLWPGARRASVRQDTEPVATGARSV
ncbi:hypothetical protein [Actinomadura sp. CNU-125]|uniref:hypothetical protein n=1 Tax=Actinomadura sp. CNU-125 TaxID=1904961 RepID=UPI0021CCA391|nr:hypothetical protein [Actinomadura sp. CNU-125]